jgi:parallel beta-helix repeat protein
VGNTEENVVFNGGQIAGTLTFTQFSNGWDSQTGSGSIIENAVLDTTVIIVDPPVGPKINNNRFTGSAGLNFEIFGGSPVISNNNINGEIDIFGGSPEISNNKIEKTSFNIDYGINSLDDSANPYISGNVIIGCTKAGIRVDLGNATIENNLILNNAVGVLIELLAHVTIRDNTITNNQVGVKVFSSSPTITYNNIENNNQNIESKAKTSITATNNWWGTTDE